MHKKRKWLLVVAIVAVITMIGAVIAPVLLTSADTVSSLQNKLQDAQKKKTEAQNGLKNVQSEISDAKTKREALDKDIAALENEIYALSAQISRNEEQIAQAESELIQAEEDAKEYKGIFQERVRVMYERDAVSYLNIIFGAESFAELLNRIELITQVAKYDRTVMQRMAEAQQAIEDKKAVLEENNKTVLLNREIQSNKKATLDANKSALSKVISSLQADEASYKATLDAADAAEEALRQEIRNMTATKTTPSQSTYSGGALEWPSPATTNITSPYGTRFHPIQKRNKMHTGIDIGAGHGTPIIAAEQGTVLLAGWNSGYGNCVVIDHGGGLQTLYGHCSVVMVQAGQTVTRGQKIALVGSTGNSTGPHLHFEVLKNGSYTNPMGYFG